MINIPPLAQDEFELFQKFLVEESGLSFDWDRSHNLRFGIWERMRAIECLTYRDYYNFLRNQAEGRSEIRELLDIVTTDETYFFRYQSQFEILMEKILPEIIDQKRESGNKSIKVWSAGCSRGDEAYSITIALLEALPDYMDWDLSIIGTDINRNALITAREAIYRRHDLGHSKSDLISKYFKNNKTDFSLNEEVKKIPRFEYHNLAKDPFTLKGMTNVDLIFCRNVTIYFDSTVTQDIINKFYDCLSLGGYLFLGHAESIWYMANKFETLEFPQTFIYKKGLQTPSGQIVKPAINIPAMHPENIFPEDNLDLDNPFAAVSSQMEEQTLAPASGLDEVNALVSDGNFESALVAIDKIIEQRSDQNHFNVNFTKASILANLARYDEAIAGLKDLINEDNLFIDAYYLMGVLLAKTGNNLEAEKQFRKVIYIDPSISMAYYNLANIYLSNNKFNKAAQELTNTIKILKTQSKDDKVRFCEEYTVEFLLQACQGHLKALTKQIAH